MENREPVRRLTEKLIAKGHTKIGFVGNYKFCLSFYERYQGFRAALGANAIEFNPAFSFTPDLPYPEYVTKLMYYHFKDLSDHPTALVCANDAIANQVFGLTGYPYFLFDNLVLSGFDNTTEYHPAASEYYSIQSFPEELGTTLGEQIIWRLEHRGRPMRNIRIGIGYPEIRFH